MTTKLTLILSLSALLLVGCGCKANADTRSEADIMGLRIKEVQIDGKWCYVGYFGADARPVSIQCD
jgi:hypothetical protein